jgi:hypothetical protein
MIHIYTEVYYLNSNRCERLKTYSVLVLALADRKYVAYTLEILGHGHKPRSVRNEGITGRPDVTRQTSCLVESLFVWRDLGRT